MRVYTSPKIRVVARLGIIAFPEFLRRNGQAQDPSLLTPEDSAILNAPIDTVEELERRMQTLPEIFDNVVHQVMALPEDKQQEGAVFLNNLDQYFKQLQQAYSNIKMLQNPQVPVSPSTEDQPQSTAQPVPQPTAEPTKYMDDWGAPVEQPVPEDLFDVTLTPKEKKKLDKIIKPPKTKKPKTQPIEPFDPRSLTPEQLGEIPTGKEPETGQGYAKSPEQVTQQRETLAELDALKQPTEKLEKNITDLTEWVTNTPDVYIKRDPARFKKDTVSLTNSILSELQQLKPVVDSLLEKYAWV